MALNRRSSTRFETSAWPGYVDALATLLMVLMFSLTIFMVVQTVLRDQITTQDGTIASQDQRLSQQDARLGDLGSQVAALSQALQGSQDTARDRAQRITDLTADLDARGDQLQTAQSRLTDFEAEVAALIAARQRDTASATATRQDLETRLAAQADRASAAELAVAAARTEIDAGAEAARLAASRREALQALIADLRRRNADAGATADTLQTQLTDAETARLTDAEAARALRARLQGADAELTAMTLALEESRRKAEETLTLLAAAQSARDDGASRADAALAAARAQLAQQDQVSQDSQRRLALLNEQVATLTARLGSVQALLDTAGEDQQQAELRVADLGQQLNAALLRTAEETQRRLALEEQARLDAQNEVRDLARYRSEFFGRLSQILSGRAGIQVVGDRFVFDSNVLFQPGAADLSPAGQDQIVQVTQLLNQIAAEIPPEIDWIIRVDGHTDATALSGMGRYRDNWELSQARALAVVRYMTDSLGFARNRLVPAGFADTRPAVAGDTPEARAQNRRIELKLTER